MKTLNIITAGIVDCLIAFNWIGVAIASLVFALLLAGSEPSEKVNAESALTMLLSCGVWIMGLRYARKVLRAVRIRPAHLRA